MSLPPLDDLLALLPDNTTGQIEPVDLRYITETLYNGVLGNQENQESYLLIDGSRDLVSQYTPVNPQSVATKKYVDDNLIPDQYVQRSGDIMTGPLFLPPQLPTQSNQAVTKAYADSVTDGFMPLSGGRFTGDVQSNGQPPSNGESLVDRDWVFSQIQNAGGGDVLQAGNNFFTGENKFVGLAEFDQLKLIAEPTDPTQVQVQAKIVRTDVSTYNLGGYDKLQFFATTDVAGQTPNDDPEDNFSIYYNCNWNDGRIVGYSGIGGVKAISGVTQLASGPRSESRNQGEGGYLFASTNRLIPSLFITSPNYTESTIAGNFTADMEMYAANYWGSGDGTLGVGQPTWRISTLNPTGSSLPSPIWSGICSDGANLYLGGWSGDDRVQGGGEDSRGTRNIVFGVHTNKNTFTTNVNEFNGDLQEGTLTYIRGSGMCYVDENRVLRRVADDSTV